MLTHGHGDCAYAHCSTSLWLGDSKYTNLSICRVLRVLERPLVKILESHSNIHHKTISCSIDAWENQMFGLFATNCMNGYNQCIFPPNRLSNHYPKPFSNKFAKDNKNKFVMVFLSLLTARDVLKEVIVGFLIVGHTYKDIDGYFNYLSKRLWCNNAFVMANLMQNIMDSKKLNFIPNFVQEIGYF